MHENQVVITEALAARLVAAQFPRWSDLPLRALQTGGSDNVLIRLGEDLVLRFPRLELAAAGVAVEAQWLPVIAPHLPLAVPEVLAEGRSAEGYPFGWAVLRWINGLDALIAPPDNDLTAAHDLAEFVRALRAVPVPDGALVMAAGGHLAARDGFTRQMIALITDEADRVEVTRIWEGALRLPAWQGEAVLIHADLHPLNLLTKAGRITAVIDWGGFCAGDPAHDLICGWMVLGDAGRALFRDLLAVDDATWARGRALAFSKAVMAAPYYRDTNPTLHRVMRRALQETMADWPR
jgi:aminoglycoside phosphotransferase (APT) family kinase protein